MSFESVTSVIWRLESRYLLPCINSQTLRVDGVGKGEVEEAGQPTPQTSETEHTAGHGGARCMCRRSALPAPRLLKRHSGSESAADPTLAYFWSAALAASRAALDARAASSFVSAMAERTAMAWVDSRALLSLASAAAARCRSACNLPSCRS